MNLTKHSVAHNLQARRRDMLRVACMIHNTPKVKHPILRSLPLVGVPPANIHIHTVQIAIM